MATKYTIYVIVTARKKEELEELVNRYLFDGYELVGGVHVSIFPPTEIPTLYQAMAKE